MLEFIFIMLLCTVVSVLIWYQSFLELQILQIDYARLKMAEFPAGTFPVVIRGLPEDYVSCWGHAAAVRSTVPVLYNHSTKRTTLGTFIKTQMNQRYDSNTAIELAQRFDFYGKFNDSFYQLRKYWYLPLRSFFSPAELWYLDSKTIHGLTRCLAEKTVITAHDGSLVVWLARETISAKEIHLLINKDPWTISNKTFPFSTDLQFIEIILRRGNTLVLPARALFAIRNGSENNGAYYSIVELHSPLSFLIGSLARA